MNIEVLSFYIITYLAGLIVVKLKLIQIIAENCKMYNGFQDDLSHVPYTYTLCVYDVKFST